MSISKLQHNSYNKRLHGPAAQRCRAQSRGASGAAGGKQVSEGRPCRPRHAHQVVMCQAHQDSGRAAGTQGASSQRKIGNISSNIEQIALINIQRYKRISQSYPHSERGRNRSLLPRALWGPRWRRRRPALTPHDFATRERGFWKRPHQTGPGFRHRAHTMQGQEGRRSHHPHTPPRRCLLLASPLTSGPKLPTA